MPFIVYQLMKKISFNNGFGKTGVCNPGKTYQTVPLDFYQRSALVLLMPRA